MEHQRHVFQRAIDHFKAASPFSKSILTLGGTGPNGSTQIIPMHIIGGDILSQLKAINIVSGSSFAYFLYQAHIHNALKRHEYINYDTLMRELHGASLFRAIKHFARWGLPQTELFKNDLVRQTVLLLIDGDFADRPLSSFDSNLNFWSYCSVADKNIAINNQTFPNMKAWQVISACLTIPFIHGHYHYNEFRFSDPIFSPAFKCLRRKLLKNDTNHLYLNFKKTQLSNNVYFLKNKECKFPTFELVTDFMMMVGNIPNPRIKKLHSLTLDILDGSAQGCSSFN